MLKAGGVNVEMIRELLGHSNVKVTEAYLKRFDLEKKREANEKFFSGAEERKALIGPCEVFLDGLGSWS